MFFNRLYIKSDNKQVGILTYKIYEKENILFINSIFVKPEFRHRGFGNELLEKCIQKAKDSGCKRVVLNVDKGKNKFSLTKWYKKLGFNKVYDHFEKNRIMYKKI